MAFCSAGIGAKAAVTSQLESNSLENQITAAKTVLSNGACGEYARYVVYSDYSVEITGTGEMWDYSEQTTSPWCEEFKSSISSVTIGEGITRVGNFSFASCSSLKEINISNTVTVIGKRAFAWCGQLGSVRIPDSVTTLELDCFAYCYNLKKAWIGAGIKKMDQGVFWNDWMTDIYIDALTPPTYTAYTLNNRPNVHIKEIAKSAYQEAGWGEGLSDADCKLLTENNREFVCNVIRYYVISEDNATCAVALDSYKGAIEIPSVVVDSSKEYRVTEIGAHAFDYNHDITSVSISEGITKIGYGSFEHCVNLQSVDFPSTVAEIEERAFNGCSSLMSFELPDNLQVLGKGAFNECGFSSLIVPSRTREVGANAFDIRGLESLYVEAATVPSVAEQTLARFDQKKCTLYVPVGCIEAYRNSYFWGDFGKIKEMSVIKYTTSDNNPIVPHSDTSLLDAKGNSLDLLENRFATNKGKIIIGGELKTIAHLFQESKVKTVVLPYYIETLTDGAFIGCRDLQSVKFPTSLKVIGTSAFNGCTSLTDLYVPDNVEEIGWYAFYYCTGLKKIWIGKGLKEIIYTSFSGCGNLESITVDSENPVFDSRDNSNAVVRKSDNTLMVASKNTIIPNTVEQINPWVYAGYKTITEVNIPEGVKRIMSNCFMDCDNLERVSIPTTLTEIEHDSFYNCRKLGTIYSGDGKQLAHVAVGTEKFVVPEGVEVIVGSAFNDTRSTLTDIILPNTLTRIDIDAFQHLSQISTITLPASLKSIGYNAFEDNPNLTSVYVKATTPPTWEDKNAFNQVTIDRSKVTIYVPKNCKEIYESAQYWQDFVIKEFEDEMAPVTGDGSTDFGNGELTEDTDLNGNVIGNILYNISSDNGSYNSAEGCLVVTKPTTENDFEGKDIFGEEFRDNFTGIVLKVEAGSGTVMVNAESVGKMTLKVRVGNSLPTEIKLTGKMEMSFPYVVNKPTYVYIYAGESSASAAKGYVPESDGSLKIYGVKWSAVATGLDSLPSAQNVSVYYNVNGQKVQTASKGIYIRDGKKYIMK